MSNSKPATIRIVAIRQPFALFEARPWIPRQLAENGLVPADGGRTTKDEGNLSHVDSATATDGPLDEVLHHVLHPEVVAVDANGGPPSNW